MKYRQLGRSELRVSEIALGSWLTFGARVDREETEACVRCAFDSGINFFDTANMYDCGGAESLLGEVLGRYPRSAYVLATKVYFPMSATDRGLSRKQIHKQIDASLKRLRTDYVDLYFCHRYDENVPLEETMEALGEVIDAGKARYIGVSHWTPRQIRAASRLDSRDRLIASQPQYSLLHRRPERRVFPACHDLGIGQIVHSPLAQGVLTGKYSPDSPPPAGSRAADEELSLKSSRWRDPEVLASVQQLEQIAERLRISMAQLALIWVLRDTRVSAAIIGASHSGQISHNVQALGVELGGDILEEIDDVLGKVVRT
jgi:aryl-alcohol dehydrogenase-like predicted oxidoreductase